SRAVDADETHFDGAAAGRQAESEPAGAVRVLRQTLRHYPPLLLATIVAYFTFRLITEPGWFVRSCTAAATTGFLLNLLVIAANGGRMPAAVSPDEMSPDLKDLYKPIDRATRLRFLADWIDLGRWVISPGDVLLIASVVASLFA
ncbi:MAG TPA: DUF5317 family protein, partial [Planctomycetaceae bacterium]